MKSFFSGLYFPLLLFVSSQSCEVKTRTEDHLGKLISSNNDLVAWMNADTNYFKLELGRLENVDDKNEFYGRLLDIYGYTDRVIVPFEESCQGELHHVYNDLEIDSDLERMNQRNAIIGLRNYFNSSLAFKCNLNGDSLKNILNACWPNCRPFTTNDSIRLLERFNNYGNIVDNLRPCTIQYFDTLLVFYRN
jgi:hypothetical protein